MTTNLDMKVDLSTLTDYGRVVGFCAREVFRQRDTPLHVDKMFSAWAWLVRQGAAMEVLFEHSPEQALKMVVFLGQTISEKNEQGLRRLVLSFPPDTPRPEHVEVRMLEWIAGNTAEAEDFTYRFLRIHPFLDGNGRTAALLYNWRKGTLLEPLDLPDFFGEPHRHEV